MSDDVAGAIGDVLKAAEIFLASMHGVTATMGQHGMEGPRMTAAQWEAALNLDAAMDALKLATGRTGVGIE